MNAYLPHLPSFKAGAPTLDLLNPNLVVGASRVLCDTAPGHCDTRSSVRTTETRFSLHLHRPRTLLVLCSSKQGPQTGAMQATREAR